MADGWFDFSSWGENDFSLPELDDTDLGGSSSWGSDFLSGDSLSGWSPDSGWGDLGNIDSSSFDWGSLNSSTPAPDDKGFNWGKFGSSFLKPEVLGPALTGALGLYGKLGDSDIAYQKLAMEQQQAKMDALMKLAALKYGQKGGGGGGGGSLRNKNQDLLDVLSHGTDSKLRALDSLTKNYLGALR